uniref:Large ribosomal subunit protein uL16m n=1 Tax=Chondrus crispus TaxID=2769 RepID=RM16_CHOCR|nr:ribosomal protein L16 [Chondrus crispus]P48955.1 RecName: Full=Large ribosomal subunit protein uL16m; AltName: Full=60S ribosomal protein L16, mitochondrial [Chondrus crispus]CAA87602.1 ribosomal protein L16 [Chondrus crispus]
MVIIKKTHNSFSLKHRHCNHTLKFGRLGLKILSFSKITENQFNLIERLSLKFLKNLSGNKKLIKIWSLVPFNLTLTKLSSEARMGKGKGAVYSRAFFLRPGSILFEFEGVSKHQLTQISSILRKKTSFRIVEVQLPSK